MSGAWVMTLPGVDHYNDDLREHGEDALRHLTLALHFERIEDPESLLYRVRYAAAHVRAWRLSMPKRERGERVAATGWMAENNRDLIHDAMKCIISADERDLFPARYLRVAEADLRTLGKKLAKGGPMIAIPIIVLLIVVAVETWLILDLTVRRRHPKHKALVHLHDWTDWSEWVEENLYSDVKVWSRQRACSECNRADRREVGRHNCSPGKGNPCPHREAMAALFEDRVTRLERELGPWGNDL